MKISLSPESSCPSSSRAVTVASSWQRSRSAGPARPASWSSFAAAPGVCRTRTPGFAPGSGSIPMTGWPLRYFAALATSPSWPTTAMMSSGVSRKRLRSARSTSA